MKKSLVKKITLSILAGAVLMSSSVVWAAEDIKDGEGNILWEILSNGTDYLRDTSNTDGVVPDGAYNENFYGAYDTITGNAAGKVTISGGTFTGDIFGVYANGNFNQNISATATNNTVNISDGTFTGNIFGGYAIGIPKFPGNTIDNTVNISGGTFTGNVFGGFVGVGNATKNTVTISGTANLENANLYGGATWLQVQGFAGLIGVYGGVAPNTLNINQWIATDDGTSNGTKIQNKVKSIQGFDKIHFEYIDWEKDGTVVEVTENIQLAFKDSAGIKGTAVTVGTVNVANGGITANDGMHLLALTSAGTIIAGDLDELNSSNKIKVTINEGVDTTYNDVNCAINKTPNTIDLVIKDNLSVVPDNNQGNDNTGGNTGDNTGGTTGNTGGSGTTPQPERNDQVLVLGESRAAAVAFTNQGSELIELGLNALARDNSKDTKVFAAVYGNHSEYETGSHVNVNGWSGIVGIGKTNANGLTVGAFFENGEGNYSTHNIFTDDYIRGDGEANYNGGGLLVRKDNANGVYAEASLRAGNLQNELRNAVRNGADLTGYDVDTFYYGAHIGIGKVIPRGADGDSLDVYGKFIYTHHDGETFDVGGTPTKFDSVESERLRLGFRINEVQTNKLSMYYGAAWEYEFNGDAHDKIASFDLETPSLEGSTVIGEIGAHYKASEKWSIDLNGRAYVGQREGFSGSVQANYSF